MKSILLTFLLFSLLSAQAQYIGVKARYTQTRVIPNPDPYLPDSRENRLILSFYIVDSAGSWTPAFLTDHDIWIQPSGLHYGSENGGFDSLGNNYPGYSFTAPRAVAYGNTMGVNYYDCLPSYMTHYVVNGHELDCGWITVSFWEYTNGGPDHYEVFNAPNIGLPYYHFPHPMSWNPGNANFTFPPGGSIYNFWPFDCGGIQQLVVRGVMHHDSTTNITVLPVRFANVRGNLNYSEATVEWSNMTESGIAAYSLERSVITGTWSQVGTVVPAKNDGGRADYRFQTIQAESQVFYRIKAVEDNGQHFYSTIIFLQKNAGATAAEEFSSTLTIYPNPVVTGTVKFTLTNASKGRYTCLVATAEGKHIRQIQFEHDGGTLAKEIELGFLKHGVYHFVLHSRNEKYSGTFIYTN